MVEAAVVSGPYNRQTFTLLRGRKSLRSRSSKPFTGNTLRSLKRTSRRGRYLSLTLCQFARAAGGTPGGRVRQPDRVLDRAKEWLDGPGAVHRMNRG